MLKPLHSELGLFDAGKYFAPGDVIKSAEQRNGEPWLQYPVRVVAHSAEQLVVYLSTGTQLHYPELPGVQQLHPWQQIGLKRWHGHGRLTILRPGLGYSINAFWTGFDRTFAGWQLTTQEPVTRTEQGFATFDLELDYVVRPDGTWAEKDRALLEYRVRSGHLTVDQAAAALTTGQELSTLLATEELWWDTAWAQWCPPSAWSPAAVPQQLDRV